MKSVAVVGTGLIGASWAAHFLAHGLDVVASDPAAGAENALRRFVAGVWPMLTRLGLKLGASVSRLHFDADPTRAVQGVDFVQENGPERIEFKVDLFATLDAQLPRDVILASSTSGLKMSDIQRRCRHPERCVIGHPFNPPHLMPLVEVAGGERTSRESVRRAAQFYAETGKRPIELHREVRGHVANRLQAALWREALHLVNEGVVSVADVDAAVSWGPGLRWAIMGPNLVFHLGGGVGGLQHFVDHLGSAFGEWWADLGQPDLTPDLTRKLVDGVKAEVAGRPVQDLARWRDAVLVELLALRHRTETAGALLSS